MRPALLLSLLTIAGLSAAQPPSPQPGFADPVLGTWDITVQGPDGAYPSWLEVMLRKETELMGRFVGRFGSNRHVAEITYAGGELMVRIPPQYEGTTTDLVFNGKLAGDRLEGTTSDPAGATVKWTAVRAPALLREAPPRWGRPIDLFNGKDLTGWKLRNQTRGACWSATGATLTNTPPCVDIITERSFTDFRIHAEYNIVPGSNSGIYLRGRYEVQINDDAGRPPDSLRNGGVYGFLRPVVNAAGKPGEWQTCEITLVGRRVNLVLNGRTIIRDSEIPGITGGALDSDEGAPGPVMLQGDHGKISFRRIVLTPAE